jgi:hypothetical protein
LTSHGEWAPAKKHSSLSFLYHALELTVVKYFQSTYKRRSGILRGETTSTSIERDKPFATRKVGRNLSDEGVKQVCGSLSNTGHVKKPKPQEMHL